MSSATPYSMPKEVRSTLSSKLNRAGSTLLLLFLTVFVLTVTGCGSGGYPGGGIVSLSASKVTIDAGQQFEVDSQLSGNPNVSWSLSGGSCSGSGCGTLSTATGGSVTYIAPATLASQIQLTLTAQVAGTSNLHTVSITVNPAPVITGNTPPGTVGVAYSTTLTASGGTGALTLSIASGTLPDGLTFNAATGVISGFPTTEQTSTFTVQVTDTSDVPDTVKVTKTLQISTGGAALAIVGNPPAGTVGTAYSFSLIAQGGTGPYTWSVISGGLPTGLTLTGASGLISGTPTLQGTYGFTAQVQDSTGATATAAYTVAISSSGTSGTLTLTPPPGGTVGQPYNGTVGVSGGTGPYTCIITGLPAGLTANNCTITGTPTQAGTSTITVTATDSGQPPATTTGSFPIVISSGSGAGSLTLSAPPSGTVNTPYSGSVGVVGGTAPYTCTITGLPAGLTANSCAITGTPTTAGTSTLSVTATDGSNPALTTTGNVPLVINNSNGGGGGVTLTLTPPANATEGTPYSGVIGVGGGTSPYTCVITGLPAGLTSNSCAITGTPTASGTATLTVTATDSGSPTTTTTGTVPLVINPSTITLLFGAPLNATVNTPYTGAVTVSGGTAPYTCAITGLPAGLASNSCAISGTPTVAGTFTLSVHGTDSHNPVVTTNGTVLLVVGPTAGSLTIAPLPSGTVNTSYNATVGVTGGASPYTCSITGLPAGLTSTNCTITGTPTAAGTSTVTVHATDSSNPTISTTANVPLVINAAAGNLTFSAPTDATVGTAYTGSVGVSGGTSPYNCSISGLPAGLTSTGCAITGTPTVAGAVTLTIHATDAGTPTITTNGTVPFVVKPPATLALTGTLPNPVLGQPYSQTLQATGGITPYTYSVPPASLPAGLTMTSDGVISGTPTAVGASKFTVTVVDTETPQQQATNNYTVVVKYPSGPNDGELSGPYAFLFQGYDDVVAGVFAYQTATVGSFTSDGQGLLTIGEQDSNHQATGTTSSQFLGTYEIGADNRGMMALTTFDVNNVPTTKIYAISVKAPVSSATVSTSAQMIEYDGNIVLSSRGAGSILQQSNASAGLSGSYVFGLSGDTPCLISCAVGLSGPVASVGQFTVSAGAISAGTSDANIAANNYATENLTGSYQTADANGRQTLAMATANTPGIFPGNYVVYAVSANQAFIMSTDSHNTNALLAGSAQLQTQGSFDSTSLSGPMIGYENAQSNPGLVGATLQNVLNLSTATIFRTAANSGTCDFTNVDVAGLNGLANQLTGLGRLLPLNIVQDLLGTYQTTGNAACSVSSDGRGVLNYPTTTGLIPILLKGLGLQTQPAPRVFYLSAPNQGYFLESGYAGIGKLEAQTGSPYSVTSLDGNFVYASLPAATLAGINSSGFLHADGNGNINSTQDLNVGVGTLNLLQLGVTASGTYNYASQDSTIGRFTYNTDVIYEISPGRFVMVDEDPLATTPTVTLLY